MKVHNGSRGGSWWFTENRWCKIFMSGLVSMNLKFWKNKFLMNTLYCTAQNAVYFNKIYFICVLWVSYVLHKSIVQKSKWRINPFQPLPPLYLAHLSHVSSLPSAAWETPNAHQPFGSDVSHLRSMTPRTPATGKKSLFTLLSVCSPVCGRISVHNTSRNHHKDFQMLMQNVFKSW